MQDLLTTDEVAKLTRAPAATLRYWRHIGTGPRSGRIGRRAVYVRADVEAWITEQLTATSRGGTATQHAGASV
jgi:DNA-binding transcriptional MerR regulator